MAPTERYLIGPDLLLGIVLKEKPAMAFIDQKRSADFVLSRLAIAIVESVIDSQSLSVVQRKRLENALKQVVASAIADGAAEVDVDASTLEKYPLYRLHTLEALVENESVPVGQEVRLLIATADAQALVYTEYDAPYLIELQLNTTLRTQPIARSL